MRPAFALGGADTCETASPLPDFGNGLGNALTLLHSYKAGE